MKRAMLISLAFVFGVQAMAGAVRLSAARPLADQFEQGATTYVIKKSINLGGKTVAVPDGSVLVFKGGSLNNGTLSGKFSVENVKKNSLNVRMAEGSSFQNEVPIYAGNDVSVISACEAGCRLESDLSVKEKILLHGNLDGNGHSIVGVGGNYRLISIENSEKPLTISNVKLVKAHKPGEKSLAYAIYAINSSDITVENCNVDGRLYFTDKDGVSKGLTIRGCTLTCDLSDCVQGWEHQQDHITIVSVCDVLIENCTIFSKDVNRVFKTSAYFSKPEFDDPSNCVDGVVLRNNTITAECRYGKQLWDMFCGTVNVLIEGNVINASGMTEIFENKAHQRKFKDGELISSTIRIIGNNVVTSGSSMFMFNTNSECDSFEVIGNDFCMGGPNSNEVTGFKRSTGCYLQGYKSCVIRNNTFKFADEAVGLPFAVVNFKCLSTEVCDNSFVDAYRINFSSTSGKSVEAERFLYSGNVKSYGPKYKSSKVEVSLEGSDVKDLNVAIPHDNNNSDYFVTFNKGVTVGMFNFDSKASSKRAFTYISDGVKVKNMKLPKGCRKNGSNWTIQ